MTMERVTLSLRALMTVSALAAAAAAPSAHAAAPGSPIGAEFQVNTYTTGDQQMPAVGMDSGGNFVVAWDSMGQDGAYDGIFAQRYAADGSRLGGEFQVNQFTPNRQVFPAVAVAPNGNFVVVWNTQDQTRVGIDVFARLYAANGTPLTNEFQVNDSGDFANPGVSVAFDNAGDFVIGWVERSKNGSVELDIRTVMTRAFGPDGTPKSASLTAHTAVNRVLRAPKVAMDAAGDFVVVWVEESKAIYGRRYTGLTKVKGFPFRIDTADSSIANVDRPSVAMDSAGDFVASWETFRADLSAGGVHARRYNYSGKAQGAEFVVGSGGQLQLNPAVAMDNAGDFVIAAHGDGIYAQRYSSTGTEVGSEIRVNSSTTHNTQLFASVGMNGTGGNFVVTWQNFQQDGDGRGVFGQLFAGP